MEVRDERGLGHVENRLRLATALYVFACGFPRDWIWIACLAAGVLVELRFAREDVSLGGFARLQWWERRAIVCSVCVLCVFKILWKILLFLPLYAYVAFT